MVIIVGGPRWKPQWKPNGDALHSSYLTLNWRSGEGFVMFLPERGEPRRLPAKPSVENPKKQAIQFSEV